MAGLIMLLIIAIITMAFFTILGYIMPGLALIISPIASILLAFVSLFIEQTEGAIIAPFIFLATLIGILTSNHRPNSKRWPKIWAKWTLISFVILLAIVTAFVLFWPGGIFGLLLFISFLSFLISYMSTSRYATGAYVVSTIGSSMRQNLPLAMALESAASGQNDRRARILRSIKEWLVQGYSLSESIKRGFPKCPSRAVAMITAAERIDQLPFAIKTIESDMISKADENRRIETVYPLYPIIVLIAMFFIILALMQFVIPRFGTVLEEMFEGAALPKTTQLLLEATNIIAYEYGWVLGLMNLLIFTIIIPVSIFTRFRPRRPDKPYLTSRIADFVKWNLPVWRSFEKKYSMVQVVEILKLSLSSGCCVNEAIANALKLDVNNCFRKRLRKWFTRVEMGNNITDSARKSKLGSSLSWAFDDKVNQGNTLAILEILESSYRSNYNYCANLVRLMMGPCMTIILGMIVGFVIYSVFCPLVAIINLLAESVLP